MKKRFTVLVFIFTLLLSLITVSFATRGDDIPRVFSTDKVTEEIEGTPVYDEITEE